MEETKLNVAEKIVLVASAASVSLLFGALMPSMPKIAGIYATVPHGPELVKMLLGIIGISMVVGCPFGGWLATRTSHRAILVASLALFGVAGASGLIFTNIYALLAGRLVAGFAGAIISTVAVLMITELLEGDRRNAWVGIFVASSIVSNIVFLPAAGYLARLGWRMPFAMYLIYLPIALLALLMRDVSTRTALAAVVVKAKLSLAHIPYFLLAFNTGLLAFVPAIYIPFLMHNVGVVDPVKLSIGLAAQTLVSGSLSAIYGRARKRIDIFRAMTFAYLVVALGLVLLGCSTSVVGAYLSLVVFGLGLAWQLPNLYAILGGLPEAERGPVLGAANSAFYVTMLIGLLIFEPVYEKFGTAGVFIGLAVINLAMYGFVVVGRRFFTGGPEPKALET